MFRRSRQIALRSEHVTEPEVQRPIWPQRAVLPVGADRLGQLPLSLEKTAQQFMGFCKIRIRTQRRFRAFLRLIESIGAGERERVSRRDTAQSPDAGESPFEIVNGLGDFAFFGKNPACQIPGVIIVGVDAKGFTQGSLGAIALSGLQQDLGELPRLLRQDSDRARWLC